HWRRWALLVVALWIVAVTVWALKPLDATVITGANADGSDKSATVHCDSPISGNTSPTSVLPTLGHGESIGDAPCHGPVTSGRTMYFIDLAAGAGIVVLLIASRGRLDERPEQTESDSVAALA
ncbi:MAG TPA: hypothetical protein VGN51_15090, partial [Acidimicrobiia bacterium]